MVYRVFVSHSSRDTPAARAVVRWLTEQEPSLEGDVFLDADPLTGIAPGTRVESRTRPCRRQMRSRDLLDIA